MQHHVNSIKENSVDVLLAISVYQAWGKNSFSKKFVRVEFNWMLGQLLAVVNCWPNANVSYTSSGFEE